MIFYFISLFAISFFKPIISQLLHFVIIVPSYNNAQFFQKNIDSIVNQKTVHNYKIKYINDRSSDNTQELVSKYIKENFFENKIELINNNKRVGALENIYNCVHSCNDNEIVILVDGDDCLAHEKVLERVAKEYTDNDAWITFGQFLYYPSNIIGGCYKIDSAIISNNSFRKHPISPSHLKTFKALLFKKINKNDLLYNGKFYEMTSDVAIMMPMLEMASKGHISFIPDILYIYNFENPISDFRKNLHLQEFLDKHIRAQKSYTPLQRLDD